MKARELIELLSKRDPNVEVMILDGANGGGTPREINLGPTSHVISAADADDTADCEAREGEKIVVLGYGCY